MRNPFTARRPWAVFLVSLIIQPSLGFLFIGRPRLAGLYFLLMIASLAVFFGTFPAGFGDMNYRDAAGLADLPVRLIGAIHATYLAWRRPVQQPIAWYGRWYTVVGIPLSWVGLVFANQHLAFPLYYQASSAMAPTIGSDDALIASRRTFDFREPERGDVIAYFNPQNKSTFIKRVIGVPKDRIEIRGGVVILNGKPLPRTMLSSSEFRQQERLPGGRTYSIIKHTAPGPYDDFPEVKVPAGSYYVLGDNRDNSMDSRFQEVGFISRANIIAVVAVRVYDDENRQFIWRGVN